MGLPKGYRKNLNITDPKIGTERRQQLLDNISEKGTYLPRGVLSRDMDEAFIEFIERDIAPTIDGEQVPAYFFVMQRWSEFQQTWGNSDQFKNMQIPFITIVRSPNTEVGSNQAGNWNIPGNKTYTYMKVPTWDGNRKGYDMYKIPQPTAVDLTYEIRLFSNRHKEINRYQEILQKAFRSRQYYIYVNGHPMPVTMESIEDETRNDLEERRYYVINCNMRLAGYLMDEDDMEVVPAKSRALVFQEITEGQERFPKITIDTDIEADHITYQFVFKKFSKKSFTFKLKYDVEFYGIDNQVNIDNVEIKNNGNVVNFPFKGSTGDSIKLTITKNDSNKDGSFYLNGTIKS